MNIYIDIETLPAGDPLDPMTLTPPGNISKKDTLDAWYQDKAPLIAEEKYRARALNSMEGVIFCLGYALGNLEQTKPTQILFGDEKAILGQLEAVIFDDARFAGSLTWVGWNILTFDIPWIWRKAIQHGFDNLRKVVPHNNRILCSDLMKIWAADFKDYTKMSAVAAYLGIPHSSIEGGEVYDLWKAGDTESIYKHCREDIDTVVNIHRRIG